MILRKIGLFLFASMFSFASFAENWQSISGTNASYDADSLTRNGDVIRVKERVEMFLSEGRRPQVIHSTIEADCKKLTSRTVYFRLQLEDGSYDAPDTIPSGWKDFRGHQGFYNRVTNIYCKRFYEFWK